MTDTPYDSIVVISFGGPEGPDDVIPFLENVTRGRGVPRERLAEVATQYDMFGGRSPINEQNLALIDALTAALAEVGIDLPIHYGNRNWHPYLADTAAEMAEAGHRRAIGIVTSAFGSYSGCRQYREDIVAATDGLPLQIDKLRHYWNHPGFIEAMVDRVATSFDELGESSGEARLVFTAHSIPTAWTPTSPYIDQLEAAGAEVARLVGERRGAPVKGWDLVFQSRSGPPQVPWLEPDVNDHLEALAAAGEQTVVVSPLGFVSDHMEVVYDLDTQAAATAAELGMRMVRSPAVGTHPAFVAGLANLVEEALGRVAQPLTAVGEPWPTPCPEGCCDRPAPPRRG